MGLHLQDRSAPAARRILCAILFASLAGALLPGRVAAASVTLRPTKDTTIYSNANLSNGAGAFLLAGSSGEKRVLRSLFAFTLAGQIPAGATINSVSLTFTINTPLASNANTVQLHRVLADWGEGRTVAPMGGGSGGAAANGDATWNDRFFTTASWRVPGGDFAAAASASEPVRGTSGTVTFASAGMLADVQAWLGNPAANFGWILVAQNESGPAVRFASRESSLAPALLVDFTVPAGGGNTPPLITTQPASQAVAAGGAVTFTAVASGTPAPIFQWRKNDAPISGATTATLILTGVTAADAGSYTVFATNAAGSSVSAVATLSVATVPAGSTARLSNLSVRAAMAAGQTLIVGFSVSGGSRPIVVRGIGPTLASFGVDGTIPDPRLELYNDGVLVGENDDWGNATALSSAFSSVGAFALIANSRDAALLQPIGGTRSLHLKGIGAGVALVELYDTGSGHTPRLVNVSARHKVGTGDNILILGFFIDGTGAKNLLIRAIGPRLADLGVTDILADPRFDVVRAGMTAPMASNDNWDASLAATFGAVGAFGLAAGSRDAALVVSLPPGSYTVQVAGANGGTGEALVEIYEVP